MRFRFLASLVGVAIVAIVATSCGSDDCRKTLTCPTGTTGEGGSSSNTSAGMGGTGAGDKATGEMCSAPGECESGFCTDGVCCSTACDGVCETCGEAGNAGTCLPVAEGSDPEDDCNGDAVCGTQTCAYATPLWAKAYASAQDETIEDMASTPAGSFVMVGNYESTLNFGGGVLNPGGGFVAQIGPSTTHNWSLSYPPTSGVVLPREVSVTVTGEIIVAGQYEGSPDLGGGALASSFGLGFFILRLDAQGNHLQSVGFGGPLNNGPTLFDMVTDSSGNVFVRGRTSKSSGWGMGGFSIPADAAFLATVTPNGSVALMTELPVPPHDVSQGTSTFVTGGFDGSQTFGSTTLVATGDDLYVAKLTTGSWDWAVNFGSGRAEGLALATVSDDVVVAGTFENTLPIGDIVLTAGGDAGFVARLNAQGTPLWAVAIEGDFEPANIAIVSGDVVIAGEVRGQIDMGDLGFEATSTGDLGFFKVTGDGTPVWATTHGDPGQHSLAGLVPSGVNVGFAGNFSDQFVFAGETFNGMGEGDIFFGVLGP